MKLSLEVAEGVHKGKLIPITLAQFIIGRDPSCQLRPSSAMISKRHCVLLVRGNKVVARDLDSTNGSFVNDKQLKGEIELHNGDRLKVGPLAFNVKLEGIPAVDKATPIPATIAPDMSDDDAAIAEMLMDIPGDDNPVASKPVALDEEVPGGSTVLEVMKLPDHAGKHPDPKKPGAKKAEASTSDAAKAILEKYSRRSRS